MNELRPCPACHRHVEIAEASCPFCSAALPEAQARRLPAGRLTRAAVFASALTGAAACGPSQTTSESPGGGDTQTTQVADAGVTTDDTDGTGDGELSGPPSPPDAGPTPDKVPVPDHDVPMPYGAPPARRRLV